MRIEIDNNYIEYTEEDDCLFIDMIEVSTKRQGIGSELVNKVFTIANENSLNVELCIVEQDDETSKSDLYEFYTSLGFEYNNEIGGDFMIW